MKHSLRARWRLIRPRFRRRRVEGVALSLAIGGLFCVMELLGVVGLHSTGQLHEHSISEVWWHPFVFATLFYLGYVVWPFRDPYEQL